MLHLLPFEASWAARPISTAWRRLPNSAAGTGRQADGRSDAAHRRARRRCGVPHPDAARSGSRNFTDASGSLATFRRGSFPQTASTSARATRPPTGRWSGGATPRFRSPNSSPPPGIHSLRNSPPRASFRPAPESVRHTAAPGAGDSPPRAAGTGSDNTSGSARHSSPPCRFPSCRHRKTDARQFRFTTIPQIKGNEKEMKGKWQIYQTKHD